MIEEKNNVQINDQDGNSTKPLLSSRLLKFRAFSNETKKMMDWDFIKSVNNLTKLISLNHVDVSEFTGLVDKNGKEIYEGDILDTKWVISFKDGMFGIFDKNHNMGFNSYMAQFREVIGNIYENPELLTQTTS